MPRSKRPIVPEEHLGPLDPKQLKRMRRRAHCDDSPTTRAHFFLLTKQQDGSDDGPCKYCNKLHSQVHKKSKIKGGTHRVKNTKGTNQITVRDLAERTGVDARIIRRLLRKQFGGGAKKVYAWNKGDSKVNEIVKAIKDMGKKGETKKADKATKKASTKGTKKAQETGGKKATKKTAKAGKKVAKATDAGKTENTGGIDMSVKRQKVAKKVSSETIKETGKAPVKDQIDAAMKSKS